MINGGDFSCIIFNLFSEYYFFISLFFHLIIFLFFI